MTKKAFYFSLLLLLWQGEGFLFAQPLMHYTSGDYKYSIQIPEDWKRSDEVRNKNVSLVMLSEEGATVSVAFYKLKNLSAEKFIEDYEKSLSSQLNQVNLQEKGVIKARDDEATYLTFDYVKDSVVRKEKVCFYKRSKEIALITASNSEDKYPTSLPVFDKIFKSFTFETDQNKVEKVEE